MNIYPKKVSEEVINILSNYSNVSLHSVFNSTFNLKIDGFIVNINFNENILPPFGITLKEVDFYKLKTNLNDEKNLKLYVYEDKLNVNEVRINFKSSDEIYSPELLKLNNPIKDEAINGIIQEIFYGSYECGFDIDCIEFINSMLDENNKNEFKKIREFFLTDTNQGFEYFIGRGKGLTPSGDDFLVGIMSIILGFENNLDKKIDVMKIYLNQNRYKLTNEISESFLINAMNKKFSRQVIDFIKSMSKDRLDKNQLKQILNYGQTSGVDLVLGMVFGYILIKGEK